MSHTRKLSLLASLGFAALLSLAQSDAALAAVAPTLGAASSFAVLGASAVTNTGSTVITGDLGIAPGLASSITNFPPGIVTGGATYAGAVTPDPLAALAQLNAASAFTALNQPCDNTPPAGNIDFGGQTLTPGVYCSQSSISVTGTLTLDALGDPNAVWIFKMPASTLTTATGSVVKMINGGQDCNVFWRVGSSATINTSSTFIGTIIADQSIGLVGGGASVSGRLLALNAAVTLDTNTVSLCSLALPPPPGLPTVGKGFIPVSINAGGGAGGVSILTIILSNPNAAAAGSAAFTDTLPSGVLIAASPSATNSCGGTLTATAGTGTITLSGGSIPGGFPAGTCTMTVPVSAAIAGVYINTLAAGALHTSNGNNVAPALATLTVVPLVPPNVAPTIGKGFNPVSINAGGGVSTLTIILSNPNVAAATGAGFTDTLPSGVVVAASPVPTNSCGGTLTAATGGDTVTLSGGSIPGSSGSTAGTCTVTVAVSAATAGTFVNTLAVGDLETSNGSNAAPSIATLTVVPVAAPGIPTLSWWGLIASVLLMGLVSVYYLKRAA